MKPLCALALLSACGSDPLASQIVVQPERLDFSETQVGIDHVYLPLSLVNEGKTRIRLNSADFVTIGVADWSLQGPTFPVEIDPGQQLDWFVLLNNALAITRPEDHELAFDLIGYSGLGLSDALVVPVRAAPPAQCDGDGDGSMAAACGGDDCDDGSDSVFPGAVEVCDGVDTDCDGVLDGPNSEDAHVLFPDSDGDGYGDSLREVRACFEGTGLVADGTDCDDQRSSVHPGAVEVCDGNDTDCNGLFDDDAVNAVTFFPDGDGDGYGDDALAHSSCWGRVDEVLIGGDCDDAQPAIHPQADESCNGVDDDCDGLVDELAVGARWFYADVDGDGFGDPASGLPFCERPSDRVADPTDCDDTNPLVFPGAVESCNGVDDDCDRTLDETGQGERSSWWPDRDGDGFGDTSGEQLACGTPSRFVQESSDCDDRDARNFPGNTEVCDGRDNDCAGGPDDGLQCSELCDNGLDDDGDLAIDCADSDCDGAPVCTSVEICDNGLDDDANGLMDCEDPACTSVCFEICDNGLDDDGDLAIDCDDSDCAIECAPLALRVVSFTGLLDRSSAFYVRDCETAAGPVQITSSEVHLSLELNDLTGRVDGPSGSEWFTSKTVVTQKTKRREVLALPSMNTSSYWYEPIVRTGLNAPLVVEQALPRTVFLREDLGGPLLFSEVVPSLSGLWNDAPVNFTRSDAWYSLAVLPGTVQSSSSSSVFSTSVGGVPVDCPSTTRRVITTAPVEAILP